MLLWTPRIVLFLSLTFICSARQFCGSDLADVMSLVCSGRGYNVAFKTEYSPADKRYKRGIVDECCRRGCSWSTLETYCSPESSDLQIRKRSDFTNKWQPEASDQEEKKTDKFKYDTNEMKIPQGIENQQKWRFNILVENTKPGYPSRQVQIPRGPSIVNKVKRNDIDEGKGSRIQKNSNGLPDALNWRNFLIDGMKFKHEKSEEEKNLENSTASVPIRHRHRKSDLSRKIMKDNGLNTSQIGTVPPYFQGRTLVLPPSRKL
uniref:Insulin-like peptide 2 n=1 Tax=Plautia stali TaxID=106108 RepID=A0A1E1G7T0_PLAST|nr:insulin-like peptide 2 [Plautia stali]